MLNDGFPCAPTDSDCPVPKIWYNVSFVFSVVISDVNSLTFANTLHTLQCRLNSNY